MFASRCSFTGYLIHRQSSADRMKHQVYLFPSLLSAQTGRPLTYDHHCTKPYPPESFQDSYAYLLAAGTTMHISSPSPLAYRPVAVRRTHSSTLSRAACQNAQTALYLKHASKLCFNSRSITTSRQRTEVQSSREHACKLDP
jgi:hypothetical protein